MYVVDPDSSKEVELDISLAHPWALDALPKAALEDGTAATRREMLQNDKYVKKVRPGGTTLNFIPLVMEHFGRWRQEAQKYLNQLSTIAT